MSTSTAKGRLRLVETPPSVEPAARAPRDASIDAATPPPAPVQSARGPAAAGPLPSLPDAQLVALGCDGEVLALEQLYRRHAAFAINLATRIEGSSSDAEDIVHDAFLKAFDKLSDLADRSAFRGWLGSIIVHAVRSRMRRGRFLRFVGLGRAPDPVDLDAIASSEASPHVRAQIAQIYALLRTLPPDERIAWTLRYVESHQLESVAALTGCSLATVKRRISRAQQFLDEHFVDAASPLFSEEPLS